ncbi:MAG: DNA polymerase III subunit alpha [Candidatus Magasanikbacteria bacterium]|nr:DNA polymerase III subunit alpha [Candidatus Magasanikbacteria bacterium]
MSEFVHLHQHTHYSLLNGLTKVKPLVKAAKKRGFKAVALTDYGSMYGAIEFYKECKKQEIKPLIGFVAYIAPRTMQDMDPEKDKDLFTLVLHAENTEGYKNLLKLTSAGHLDGFYNGKPRLDKALLRTYSSSIIALSGGISGEIPQAIVRGKLDKARELAEEYNDIFGQDNFYLELQDHPALEGQMAVNTELIAISKELNIPMVVTRDIHYLNPDEAEAQDILRCVGAGWKVGYSDREDLRHVDRSMNSAEDITSRFRHVPEALENTAKIAARIDIKIELDNWHFAPVEIPDGTTYDEVLRKEAYKCAPAFYPEMGDVINERIEYELDIIKTKGYSPYFLCVADYVRYAKSKGIVESTRGSAAGSLVSYVIGITTVDPIRFKLPFERFLNPFRPSAPDVDTDFADDRRQEMIEYVTEKYGVDKVAQIITFGTMQARAAVRDVGRALGLSYSFCDQVAKLIPAGAQGFPMTLERAMAEEPDLKKLFDTNEDVNRLLTLAQKVEGCARHTSIHAAGVVISPTPLTDFTPVQRETGGDRLVTQYEMHSVEAAGVLKNDFLGIRNLTILGKAVEIVKATMNEDVDIYSLPLEDKPTFDMLARGETMGVFQMASSGMTRWLKELAPTSIDDIMAMVALYRPGPMDFIPEYIERAHDASKIDYPHPDLEEILEKSLGLLIYQDDVMLTAIKLAGYDWLEADKFRKAMGKKIPELMKEQESKFKGGCVKNGIAKSIADELWERIKPFATYAFNKAHAASYGMVAYQTAYMKAHYPVQFMTAILHAEAGDIEKVAAIVGACRQMKIEVLPPDVNESFKNFAMVSKADEKPGRIRFGLTAIKNVGEHICEVIYKERKANGQYASLEDLLERVQDKDMNKRSLDSLIKVGALDCFGHDRGLLISNLEHLQFYNKQVKEHATSHQDSLFAGTAIEFDEKVVLKPANDATLDEMLTWEKQLLGLYISSHPVIKYEKYFKESQTALIDVEHAERDDWVITLGVIEYTKKKITKKGDVMMFVTIQDTTANMELLVFPKTYAKTQSIWVEGTVVCVVGKTPREHGDNKIFVENAHVLDEANAEVIGRQVSMGSSHAAPKKNFHQSAEAVPEEKEQSLTIFLSKADAQLHAGRIKSICGAYPGDMQVIIDIEGAKIEANFTCDGGSDLIDELEDIVGLSSISLDK